MPDKKLTDNEIVKAFECCYVNKPCEECPLCEIAHSEKMCFEGDGYAIPRMIIDLINRQKAENERLKEVNEKQRLIVEAIDDNMFPLPFETDYDKAIKTAKAEAYKEVLKKVCTLENQSLLNKTAAKKMKNLLKEMVGDK